MLGKAVKVPAHSCDPNHSILHVEAVLNIRDRQVWVSTKNLLRGKVVLLVTGERTERRMTTGKVDGGDLSPGKIRHEKD